MNPTPLAACLLLATLVACGGIRRPSTAQPDVKGVDHFAVFPVLRADIELPGGEFRFGDIQFDSGLNQLALELQVETVDGSFSSSQDADFRMVESSLALDVRSRGEPLSGGLLFGVTYYDIAIDAHAPIARRERRNDLGLLVGGYLERSVWQDLDVYGRAEVMALQAKTYASQLEVGFSYELNDRFTVLTSYRWWKYNDDHGPVEYDVRAQGVLIGVEAHFRP